MTRPELQVLDIALDDLTKLAVLYERRLIFKGRYQEEAQNAAASRRAAKRILDRGLRGRTGTE